MNKKNTAIWVSLLLCMTLLFCACEGCGGAGTLDKTPLTEAQKSEMIAKYHDVLLAYNEKQHEGHENYGIYNAPKRESVTLMRYYGETHGVKVALYWNTLMSVWSLGYQLKNNIAGKEFDYFTQNTIAAYDGNNMYLIGEAYEKGILSEADIESIYEADKNWRFGDSAVIGGEPLTDEMSTQLCDKYHEAFSAIYAKRHENDKDIGLTVTIDIEDIRFTEFYGEINDTYVIIMSYPRQPNWTYNHATEWSVADKEFKGIEEIRFVAYKDGQLSTLCEAYEKNWLRKEDIAVIYDKYTYYDRVDGNRDFENKFDKRELTTAECLDIVEQYYDIVVREHIDGTATYEGSCLKTTVNKNDIELFAYLGKIRDVKTMVMWQPVALSENGNGFRPCIVADVAFDLAEEINIMTYKNGQMCSITEAYEKGWICTEDIAVIHDAFEDAYSKNNKVHKLNAEQITEEQEGEMKNAYCKYLDFFDKNDHYRYTPLKPYQVSYVRYIGDVGGVKVAIMRSPARAEMIPESPSWCVAGKSFKYIWQKDFVAYKDGKMCWLGEAYGRGWLNNSDIEKIYDVYSTQIVPKLYSKG